MKKKKKQDNTILILAAIGVAAYFLLKKKKKKGQIIVSDSWEVERGQRIPTKNLNRLTPFVDQENYFKDQYQQSLNACSY